MSLWNYQAAVPQFNYMGGPPQPVVPAQGGFDTKQVIDSVIYDSKYFVAGTAVPTTTIRFFQVQQGQLDTVANNNAIQFTKTIADTNMVQAGQLQRGQTLDIYSIQAQISIPGNFDLTQQGAGNTTLGATFPTSAVQTNATAGVIASNLLDNVIKRGVITLKIANHDFESGQLIQFPSEFGVSGFATSAFSGTATAAVTTVPTDGIANNGFGRPRTLVMPRKVLPGQNFSIDLTFPVAFTPSRNFEIILCLRGILWQDVA